MGMAVAAAAATGTTYTGRPAPNRGHKARVRTHFACSYIVMCLSYCLRLLCLSKTTRTAAEHRVQSHSGACMQARPAHAAEPYEGQDEDLPAVDDMAIAALAAAGAPDPVGPVLRKALGEESEEEEDEEHIVAITEDADANLPTQQVP